MQEQDKNTGAGKQWETAPNWPTESGSSAFWEELGRTVAAFGTLEDTLAKALFTVEFRRRAAEGEKLGVGLEAYGQELVKGLSDTLRPLAKKLEAAWRDEDRELSEARAAILDEIRALKTERNRLCHGAWVRFEKEDEGSVRYYPRMHELSGAHTETRSLASIAETRERATRIVKAVLTDMAERYRTSLSGTGRAGRNPH